MPSPYIKHSMKKRADAQVGETVSALYLDSFLQAYDSHLTFDGRARKAYFFDINTVIEQGGLPNKDVMIGVYEKDGQFHELQQFTPPPNGQLVTFTKGQRYIEAVMFPIAVVITNNTFINGYGGQVTANALENLLGLQAGDIQNFTDDGTDVSFFINVDYDIPNLLFNNNATIEEYIDSDGKIQSIGISAFEGCMALKNVEANNCTSIGLSCFSGCEGVLTYSLNNCTSIGSLAFFGNLSLTSLSLPSALTLYSRCFEQCSSLTSLSIPLVTDVEDNAFALCSALMDIDLSSAVNISKFAFDSWGGAGYTLTVPSALSANAGVLNTQSAGTTVIFI